MGTEPIQPPEVQPITIPRADPLRFNALRYNGTTTFLEIPAVGTFDAFTLEIWPYIEAAETTQTILADDGETGTGLLRMNAVPIPAAEGGGWKLELAIQDNQPTTILFAHAFRFQHWYYMVITRNGRDVALYVNGLPVETRQLDTCTPITIGPATVGIWRSGRGHLNPLNGAVGRLRVWQGVMPEKGIQTVGFYQLNGRVDLHDEQGNVAATLKANWPANEGYGDTAYNRSGSHNARRGDGYDDATQPAWVVWSITDEPTFFDSTVPVIGLKTLGTGGRELHMRQGTSAAAG